MTQKEATEFFIDDRNWNPIEVCLNGSVRIEQLHANDLVLIRIKVLEHVPDWSNWQLDKVPTLIDCWTLKGLYEANGDNLHPISKTNAKKRLWRVSR